MRKAAIVLALALAVLTVPVPAWAASRMPLRHVPAGANQLLIVHATTPTTSYATVETFDRAGAGWQRRFASMPARVGRLGFSDHHVEGTPNTPTGTYPIGATMYGIDANPGVRYPYHRLVSGDYWNENSASRGYNTFYHGRDPGGPSEALWRIHPAYRHFAVINYNTPAVANRGSGIFLHEGTGGPTAGCVSLGHDDLVRVLKWLDPRKSPRVVLSPDQWLSRY
jgi:L,D-peptidoglycan transpeptidase YkuD (ErfK/YbiS/YcfS/YnhG family)